LKLKMTLVVDYETNDEPTDFLKKMLENVVHSAMDNGLLTGDSCAVVDEYRVIVEEVLDE